MGSKRVVILVISLVLAVILGGIAALFLYGQPVKMKINQDLDFVLDEDIKEILTYASLAPSSHNTQNWFVAVSPDRHELKISVDEERILTVIDSERREALISIGAFVTNLLEAFEIYGYTTTLTLDDRENELICARVGYDSPPYPVTDVSAVEVFVRRHTNKSAFQKTPLPEDILNTLLQNHADYLRYMPAESDDGKFISQTTLAAFTQQANDQEARHELSLWLRFSDKEVKAKKDGLPAEQLGLRGPMKTLYYLTTNRESSQGDTWAKQGIDMAKTQLDGCAGFFLITGQDGKKGWLEAGMHLQTFWLDAVRHGIAIQPMSAALGESPYREELAEKYAAENKLQMILRAGLVDVYGENAMIRRDLNEFIILDS